ncbi:MAG: prepilin-type N-terminal cleavage/methylation domain-containing protein [Burkholderiales bacterium]
MTEWRSSRRNAAPRPRRAAQGFTLTELAIAFVIIAIALGGLALTLSAQNEARQFSETQARLETAREALIGFAIRNGRLPCPATAASNGLEAPAGGGACTASLNGYLPGASLGLAGVSNGYLLDAWDVPIRYAVTNWSTNTFTTSGQVAAKGVTALNPPLRICSAAACGSGQVLTAPDTVVAVLYSLGKNRLATGLAADEAQNQNGDNDFVSHEPRPAGGGGGEFDDLVTWLPLNILVNRMVTAGAL